MQESSLLVAQALISLIPPLSHIAGLGISITGLELVPGPDVNSSAASFGGLRDLCRSSRYTCCMELPFEFMNSLSADVVCDGAELDPTTGEWGRKNSMA